MKRYAILNNKKILIGYDLLEDDVIPSNNQIEVEMNCDLEINRYIYNIDEQRFDSMSRKNQIPFDQKTIRIIYLALKAINESTLIDFPPEVVKWIERIDQNVST